MVLLEAVASIFNAYLIVLIQTTFKINEYSFKSLLLQRMNEVDEWMVFKIQQQQRPDKLNVGLTTEMYESFVLSFSQDHNMIVEEF